MKIILRKIVLIKNRIAPPLFRINLGLSANARSVGGEAIL